MHQLPISVLVNDWLNAPVNVPVVDAPNGAVVSAPVNTTTFRPLSTVVVVVATLTVRAAEVDGVAHQADTLATVEVDDFRSGPFVHVSPPESETAASEPVVVPMTVSTSATRSESAGAVKLAVVQVPVMTVL
jgi:hypothetical protein